MNVTYKLVASIGRPRMIKDPLVFRQLVDSKGLRIGYRLISLPSIFLCLFRTQVFKIYSFLDFKKFQYFLCLFEFDFGNLNFSSNYQKKIKVQIINL